MQERERNTVRVLVALALGLLLSACTSGSDRNPSEVTQIGSALNGACTPSTPCSVWDNTATPAEAVGTSAVELGVKVQSTQAGFITGVRFYKSDTNSTHTVHLWTGTGTLLATATSTIETSSGWQTVSFAAAVTVSANTTYVASYFMPGGNFSLTRYGLSSAVVNAPLQALANGQDGGNAVYAYGSSSSFPSSTFAASNYWVDILFTAPVSCTSSSPCSIWPSTATPAEAVNTSAVELGVKVQSSQTGFISGVRFYKSDASSTHTVNLWTRSGTLLATANSTSETGSGWQSVSFATPVAVSGNTTYVASYFMPGGAFALTRAGLSTAVVNSPLQALADGQDGGNGLYSYGSTSSFPTSTFSSANYWVDILFYPSASAGDAGADGAAGDSAASDGAASDSTTSDGGGGCTQSSPCSIWPPTATPAEAVNTSPVELGVKVQSSQAGFITGVRFYKSDTNATHTVHLWSSLGNVLATATSTSETSAGWQTVSFAQPVGVSANTTYVASYFMPGGNFALTRYGLSSAVVNAPLQALANGQDGGNAVYAYGSSSSFPSSTFGASNYWVDIRFYASATSDGGAGDGGTDASSDGNGPNTIQQYAVAYGQAYCTGLGKCCPGYPGSFDQTSCAAAWTTLGWESTLPANAAVYTAGHLTYNATQGGACLSALQNFACTSGGTVTAAQYSPVTNACLGVLTGTIPVGSGGCLSSFECINGYCAAPADGGTGTCTALVGIGGTCAPGVDSQDQMCSQVGTYQPNSWCNRLAGGASGTCAAPLADTTTCYNAPAGFYSDYGCSSLMCGDLGCGGSTMYPTTGFCANWPADAGGGG